MIYENKIEDLGFEITPEQIRELREYVNSDKIEALYEMKTKGSLYEVLQKDSEKWLEKSALLNISRVQAKYAEKIFNVIQYEGLNKQSSKKINELLYKAFEEMGESIKIKRPESFKGYDPDKIRKSFSLVFYCIFWNTIIDLILSLLLGLTIGNTLTAIICAPIVEESAKRISIEGGFETEFYVVFNIFEFTNYVINYASYFGLSKIVMIRLLAVGFHGITTLVQYLCKSKKIREVITGDENNENEKVKNTNFLIAILLHALWNAGIGGIIVSTVLGDS